MINSKASLYYVPMLYADDRSYTGTNGLNQRSSVVIIRVPILAVVVFENILQKWQNFRLAYAMGISEGSNNHGNSLEWTLEKIYIGGCHTKNGAALPFEDNSAESLKNYFAW